MRMGEKTERNLVIIDERDSVLECSAGSEVIMVEDVVLPPKYARILG